jgi:hypothetical protein
MYLDKQNSFAFNTSMILGAQAATLFGDVIDLWGGNASLPSPVPPVGGPMGNVHDIFAGNQPTVFAQITTAVAQAANTFQFDLITADAADLTGNPLTLWSSGALTAATAVAGYKLRIPPEFATPLGRQHYLGWKLTITTTAITAGAFTSGFAVDVQSSPGSFA